MDLMKEFDYAGLDALVCTRKSPRKVLDPVVTHGVVKDLHEEGSWLVKVAVVLLRVDKSAAFDIAKTLLNPGILWAFGGSTE